MGIFNRLMLEDDDDDGEADAWGSAVEVWLSVSPELSDLIC